MSAVSITIDDSALKVSLGKFQLSLAQNGELMGQIGAAMLLSVRKTFRAQGSPDDSWMPLAESTIRSNPRKYGAGHKLLVDKGTLLGSIASRSEPGLAIIGTNLKYARVHQFGSRDRGAIGVGPRTRAQHDATVSVKEHTYNRMQRPLGKGRMGNRSRLIYGPLNRTAVNVGAHARHQNIPARPYLVFRPEDPRRIQSLVNAYCRRAAAAARLGGS